MKSKRDITSSVRKIAAENRKIVEVEKWKGLGREKRSEMLAAGYRPPKGDIDYAAARRALRGITPVPAGRIDRMSPQQKGSITRALKRIAVASANATPVIAKTAGRKAAASKISGQSKRDTVHFVKVLNGEEPVFRQRAGKPVLILKSPEYSRTFIGFDMAAITSGDPEEQLGTILGTMKQVQGNALMIGAGPYVFGSSLRQGGRKYFDASGVREAIQAMFSAGTKAATARSGQPMKDWATGVWDVTDSNLPTEMGLGDQIAAAEEEIRAGLVLEF